MITRFDHVVIAVPDLPTALDAYASLGFDVAAGGRHPSIGTANAIIRFGLDYIELLAIEDPTQARVSGAFGADLADQVARASGLVGFVLASNDLDSAATALTAIGQSSTAPFAMDRLRPDGRRLDWRLVIPGGSPWRKPWPFLIQWDTPDADRLNWDTPGSHANGASGVAGLEVLVADLTAARRFYETGLGLLPAAGGTDQVRYALDDFTLDVFTPATAAQRQALDELGPGPWRLLLRTRGPKQSLPTAAALGARIDLMAP